jgi:hypothetical protein
VRILTFLARFLTGFSGYLSGFDRFRDRFIKLLEPQQALALFGSVEIGAVPAVWIGAPFGFGEADAAFLGLDVGQSGQNLADGVEVGGRIIGLEEFLEDVALKRIEGQFVEKPVFPAALAGEDSC